MELPNPSPEILISGKVISRQFLSQDYNEYRRLTRHLSDGVTETGIESGQEYGEDRLVAAIQAARREKPARIVDRVLASVRAFYAGPQHDDITLIVLRGI